MINLAPIPSKIQQRLFEKMNALGRVERYPDSKRELLTLDKMSIRTTFIKMVSGQENPYILMGGELLSNIYPNYSTDSDGNPTILPFPVKNAVGYDEIYGPRVYHETIDEWTGDYEERGQNVTKRPMPGIKSIDVQFKGGVRALREATVSWTCWSFDDIDRLMPHFLAHGKTVMIEWGWVYDKKSLLDLPTFVTTDEKGGCIRKDAFTNPMEDVVNGKGDFDYMIGIVKNFEFTTREDGAFDCQTIISSVGVSLIDNPTPSEDVLDPGLTYNLDLREDTTELATKLESATGETSLLKSDGTFDKNLGGHFKQKHDAKDQIVDINTTVTLKAFIKNIDTFIYNELGGGVADLANNKNIKELLIEPQQENRVKKSMYRYKPNCFISFNPEGGHKTVLHPKDAWVRWGWFEDNVLSKFLSVTAPDSDKQKIVTMFRSIENIVNNKGEVTPNYESVRIRNHEFLETININRYILPGQFTPQGEIKKGTPYNKSAKELGKNTKVSDGKGQVEATSELSQVFNYDRDIALAQQDVYNLNWIGNSELYDEKLLTDGTATRNMLRAIIAHDDLSSEDMAKVKEAEIILIKKEAANTSPVEQDTFIGPIKKETFPIDLPGDDEKFHKLATIVNDTGNFPCFATKTDTIEKVADSEYPFLKSTWNNEGSAAKRQAMVEASSYDNWKTYSKKVGKEDRKKDYDKLYGKTDSSEKAKPGKFGYLRNMLINTKLIKQAFGVSDNDDFTIETINIFEALENLFSLINQDINFWNFTVTVDSVEDYRSKIIDDAIADFDFNATTTSQRSQFINGEIKVDDANKAGVFYFPVWRHDSIVKRQNVTAKVPNELALATMYGSNMNQLKDFSNPGNQFSEKAGVIAGGLYNNTKDESKAGLDIAFRNEESRKIGNESGAANEPLVLEGPTDLITLGMKKTLEETYEQRLYKVDANIKAAAKDKAEESKLIFDDRIPPPLINQMDDEQIAALLKGEKEGASTLYKSDEFAKLYSSKYQEDGKIKPEFKETIRYLTTNHGKYTETNSPVVIPMDLELDIDGTGGIYPGNSFHSTYLPKRYQESTVFQMFDVNHRVDSSGWTTSITGKMRTTMGRVFKGVESLDELYQKQFKQYLDKAKDNAQQSGKKGKDFQKQNAKAFMDIKSSSGRMY